ncbi:hypothetical protein BZL54_20215 [Burkholderia ubonensis subsp. mesacidophila]|uniref:Uncharacterized protein n=1 Tax=Burkholderia ubonensis subsp. mesacidophila TaxID=265293 RepID=A0A2A4F9P4_9BURK|nr:hypothetical protein BZL54_20215 [Burkholderia ubonensis subsp. mesacidophila]
MTGGPRLQPALDELAADARQRGRRALVVMARRRDAVDHLDQLQERRRLADEHGFGERARCRSDTLRAKR